MHQTLQSEVMLLKKVFCEARPNSWCDEKDMPVIENPIKKTKSRNAVFLGFLDVL